MSTVMTTAGLAHGARPFDSIGIPFTQRPRKQRKTAATTRQHEWNSVALASPLTGNAAAGGSGRFARLPAYAWLLIVAAVLIHASLAWFIATHVSSHVVAPKPSELNLEIVRSKPPEPKIEPPKPPPPKPEVKRVAPVVPPIQQAVPEPSDAPAAVSTEAPVAAAPAGVAPEPAPAPEPETAPIGGAGYLNNPPPDYPAAAARQGWQGTVMLRVRVTSTGKVDSVEVQKSSGRRILDDEAVRTVKSWTFTPSKRGSTPIDGWATVPIEFSLQQ